MDEEIGFTQPHGVETAHATPFWIDAPTLARDGAGPGKADLRRLVGRGHEVTWLGFAQLACGRLKLDFIKNALSRGKARQRDFAGEVGLSRGNGGADDAMPLCAR